MNSLGGKKIVTEGGAFWELSMAGKWRAVFLVAAPSPPRRTWQPEEPPSYGPSRSTSTRSTSWFAVMEAYKAMGVDLLAHQDREDDAQAQGEQP